MTAPAAAVLPFDPPPPPPARSQASSANSGQFLTLLAPVEAPPKTASASIAPPSISGHSGAAVTLRVVPASHQTTTGDQAAPSSSNGAAVIAVVPVPVPPPQPPAVAQAGAATVPAGAATAVPQPLPAALADALALPTSTGLGSAANAPLAAAVNGTAVNLITASVAGTAVPAGSAGTGATSNGTAFPALLAQTLPPVAANLSLRLAATAAQLVSQPSITLASVAPETAAKPAGPEADLAALNRQSLLTGAASGLTKTALAAPTDELSKAVAKAAAEVTAQLAPDATGQGPAQPPAAVAPAAAPAASPLAAMAPPVNLANVTQMPVAMPIPPNAAAEQVAVTLRQAVNAGNDHIQIQLQPADLGAVEVKLSINHDGRVTMVVSADRSDTLNLLQQDAGGLAQALRHAGLQADSSSLSFNLRGGYQFNQQQAGSGAHLADHTSIGGIDGIDAVPAIMRRAHAGSLDIHV